MRGAFEAEQGAAAELRVSTCEFHSADAAVRKRRTSTDRQDSSSTWRTTPGPGASRCGPTAFRRRSPRGDHHRATSARACASWATTARGRASRSGWRSTARETQNRRCAAAIMRATNHDNVGLCWNSNPTDVVNGSVKQSFELLRPVDQERHINELAERLSLARVVRAAAASRGYDRYTLCEVQESKEPERFLRCYRALWTELTRAVKSCRRAGRSPRRCRGRRCAHAARPLRPRNRRRPRRCSTGTKVVSYFQALERPATGIRVAELGKTTEGRPFIARAYRLRAETLQRLDRYREIQARLGRPAHAPPKPKRPS